MELRQITARFAGRSSVTGTPFQAGDTIIYCPSPKGTMLPGEENEWKAFVALTDPKNPISYVREPQRYLDTAAEYGITLDTVKGDWLKQKLEMATRRIGNKG